MEDIAGVFAGLRFRKRLIGGVEERDVWKKLDEVQAAYRKVYEAQHERDLALIEERDDTIRQLTATLEAIKAVCGDPAAGVKIPKTPKPVGKTSKPSSDPDGSDDRGVDSPSVKGVSRSPEPRASSRKPVIYSDSGRPVTPASEYAQEPDFDWFDDEGF